MENELFETPISPLTNNWLLSASLLSFDFPALIDKMKHKQTWENGELNSTVLLKSTGKQIVLTILHEGTEIKSFQSSDSITFEILEGKLTFHAHKETILLEKGKLLTLRENIKYSLTTIEDTVLLLTIANSLVKSSEN
jgi:quercetin dioxygenase-like cupin family protein